MKISYSLGVCLHNIKDTVTELNVLVQDNFPNICANLSVK